jgi:hypothetical protein
MEETGGDAMTTTWIETRYLRVPLTDAELQARGEALARQLKAIDEFDLAEAERRATAKETRTSLKAEAWRLAHAIRERSENRAIAVEVRLDETLHLVEVVRPDTGELIETREPRPEDRVHAALEMLRGDEVAREESEESADV